MCLDSAVPFSIGWYVDTEGSIRETNRADTLVCAADRCVYVLGAQMPSTGEREVLGEFEFHPSLDALKARLGLSGVGDAPAG